MTPSRLRIHLSALPLRAVAVTLAVTGGLASCSTSPASSPASSDGGNGLSGSYAFPVSYALIDSKTPNLQCGDTTALPAGGYASFVLWLSDVDPFDDAGNPLGYLPAGAHLVRIELAGPGATTPLDAGPVAVMPGTYTVGFEGQNDDDLCMLPAGASAILDVFDFSADSSYTQATAASGTVTLTSVVTGQIQGSFAVQLSQSPFRVTQPTFPFSGSFDARTM
jgi:hypothetical protein